VGWRKEEGSKLEYLWKGEVWKDFVQRNGFDLSSVNKLLYSKGFLTKITIENGEVESHSVSLYIVREKVRGAFFAFLRVL
jgi:hypothetical protein